tara:strand:+ start:45 stop:527 length:483 start_codon:yes stop_codon:yes gene_type:complete
MPIELYGKKYETVAERINRLAVETEGNYSIKTDYDVSNYPIIIVKALLTIGENTFTGHAMGDLSNANLGKKVKGKILEATETHSIGRALASSSRNGGEFASADEMLQNSGDNQEEKLASDKQKYFIDKLCNENGLDSAQYITDELTNVEASKIIQELKGE